MKKIVTMLIGTGLLLVMINLPSVVLAEEEIEEELSWLKEETIENKREVLKLRLELVKAKIRIQEEKRKEIREDIVKLREKVQKVENEKDYREAQKKIRELEGKIWKLESEYSDAQWELERLKRLEKRYTQELEKLRQEEEERKLRERAKLIRLGLAIGSLEESEFGEVAEAKLRTNLLDLFYGGNGAKENEENKRVSYYGMEKSLIQIPLVGSIVIKLPIGLEKISYEKKIRVCAGIIGECEWRNIKGNETKAFLQARWGFSQDNKAVVTFLVGVFF